MSDLISRADAIEALRGLFDMRKSRAKVIVECFGELLNALPSAELTLQTPQTYGKSINPSNAEVVADLISRADIQYHTQLEPMGNGQYRNVEVAYKDDIDALPSAEAEPMTEEVREALMRLSMCAREDCVICKYKDKCNFDFQYEESTKNMNTILDSLMRSKCEVDAEWIPCSERLPSEEDCPMDCMVTRRSKFIGNYVDMAVAEKNGTWTHEDWKAISYGDVESGRKTGLISTRDDEIIAWIPLPKPYREDREDYELATEQMEHDARYEPTYNPEDGSM